MRPDIYDTIFQSAKKYIEEKSIYSPKVSKNAPTESKIFPLVVIPECKVILDKETLNTKSDKEKEYKIIFDVEIYATDKTVGTKKIARQTIIHELQQLIYEVFEQENGMLGKEPQPRPNADINVARQGIEFAGRLKNNVIYRR